MSQKPVCETGIKKNNTESTHNAILTVINVVFLPNRAATGTQSATPIHIRDLAYSKEQAGVKQERPSTDSQLRSGRDDVGEIVGYGSTADGTEQIKAKGGTNEYPPGFVAQ